MKFSIAWLGRHLHTSASVQILAERLTQIGLEVDEIVDEYPKYDNFVIAEIMDVAQHPNAQKLQICSVFDGENNLQIVCGASNARAGIKVVLAKVGAIIPKGNFPIKVSKIREVESNGMLCSKEELGLEEESSGILEVPGDVAPGTAFRDWWPSGFTQSLEVAITPNRGDAASVRGIARDLAAAGLGDLKPLDGSNELEFTSSDVVLNSNPLLCQEICIVRMSDVNPKADTPKFIEADLRGSGKSINNLLVNISNHAMFDLGRPNHIYDADKVEGNIEVRLSREGEKFIALGGVEHTLPEGLLIISDEKKALSLAGVMGGELSKVDDNTKNILVEVANFHPSAVSSAGRKLNIISDSRYRFERRVDASITKTFASHLCSMIKQYAGGTVEYAIYTEGERIVYPRSFPFQPDEIRKISGCELTDIQIVKTIEGLGFKVKNSLVEVPSFRMGDVSCMRDLAEEVLRIYGMDNIESKPMPLDSKQIDIHSHDNGFIQKVRLKLLATGFVELITYAFISKHYDKLFGFPNSIKIANPISEDMSVMRQSHIPMLLQHASSNIKYGISDAAYYEIGNNFLGTDVAQQVQTISGLRVGKVCRKHFLKEEREVDFFDIKSDIYSLCKLSGLETDKLKIVKYAPSYYHPGQSASISLGKKIIGYFGKLHPSILGSFDIKSQACAFELYTHALPKSKNLKTTNLVPVSYFQSVTRDFAFVIDEDLEFAEIATDIKKVFNGIEEIRVFDIYKNDSVIGKGKKSLAFSVTLRPSDATFTEEQIDVVVGGITSIMENKYSGIQR